MIKRYFYILSASLFILLSPTTGVKADIVDKKLKSLSRKTNSPPDGINYQAAIRDDNGNALVETPVTIRISLLSDAQDLWVESHETTTDTFGMVHLVIGAGERVNGTVSNYEDLDWSMDMSFTVELDRGDGFINLGGELLQSVPYANYAANGLTSDQADKLESVSLTAEENVQSDWNQTDTASDEFIQNKPTIPVDVKDLTDADGLLTQGNFDGSFNSLKDVPANLDTDATDDFSGSYNDLSDLPANIDTDATDDFSGSYTDLTNVPANLDTDATDDFSGSYADLTNIPANIDTDKTDDFSGSYNDLSDLPANIDTDKTDDFSGSYNDLTDLPANLDTDATNDFSGSYTDLTNKPTIPSNIDGLADGDGNSALAGTFTANSLVVNGAFTLPTADGTNGQVLTTNGSGVASWGTASSGAFGNSSNVISAGDSDDDFVFGSTQLANASGTDDSKRMFFDKSKGAFRAGYTSGTQWDDANIGTYSAVLGGVNGTASGNDSFVGGGFTNVASGTNSFIGGGHHNTASAVYSAVVGGTSSTASGKGSIIIGGNTNTASGLYSAALGKRVNAQAWGEFALGTYSENAASADADSFVATDRLITVGNGTADGSRSNAMTMLKNGNTDINGTFTANSLGVDGAFTLPTADGTNGQVLTTNGSGVASWGTASSGAFANSSNLVSAGDADDDFVFGSTQLANASGTDDSKRMFFDKSKGSFRAGSVTDAQWDDSNVGDNTAVIGGSNNTASGTTASIIGGSDNTASGYGAFMGGGFMNNATGARSFVGSGITNTASGSYSATIGGRGLEISSSNATAIGKYNSTTSGSGVLFVIGNGTSSSAKSDALVVKDDGSADLNGTFKANSLGVDGAFTLPTADGTNGQVLSTNGSGTVAWSTASSGAFGNSSNLVSAGDADDDFVFGSAQLADDNTGTNDDNRMFFDKSKGAFRAGSVTGTQWDDGIVGNFSTVAGGLNNTASGTYSTVVGGYSNTASEFMSTVGGGRSNTASGRYSFVAGREVKGQARGEFAVGLYSVDAASANASSFVATDRLFTIGNGASAAARSNALVMLKNGNTDINGTFTANSLGVDGAFTLPTADGTNGQVLTTNGSGAVAWGTASSGAFGNSSNLVSAGDADDDFVFGSAQLADAGTSSEDRRMFFDKSKGAFRAGHASGTQWDDASVGNNSAAIGGNGTIASGIASFVAGGYTNVASGAASFVAGGGNNTASEDRSVVVGGYGNNCSGQKAIILGGEFSTASATNSTVIGGNGNTASGQRSLAAGSGVNAQAHSEFAIGTNSLNASSPDANNIVATDRLFTIGNGTSTVSRSNALVVLKNGNTDINGALTANSVGVDGAFTLPTADGTDGQVLTTNGSGAVAWETPSASVTTISANTTLTNANEIVFISGAFTATLPASPADGMKVVIAASNPSAVVNGNGKTLHVGASSQGTSISFADAGVSLYTFYYSSTLDLWLGAI